MGWAAEWALTFKNLLLPIFCKRCGMRLLTEENGYFCPTCWEQSPRIERPFCTGCGRPHESMMGFGARQNFPCAACREKPPKHLRRIYGAMRYEDTLADAIRLFKFYDKPLLAAPLADVLRDFIAEELDPGQYDVLTPVPLHKVRLRERGYNQSELLARAIADCFPNATVDTSLTRIRPTRTQSRLAGTQRRSNVKGAFAVLGDGLKGKRVLLVDDVVTTSTTVSECARALKRAGATSVDVLAVALATVHRHALDG
jgi:ComF family protein